MSDEREIKTPDPEIPDELALVPIRDLVVFPYMIVALRVSRPVSIEAVTRTLETDERLCFLASQRDPREDAPGTGSFFRMGTIGTIMRMRKLTEGGLKIVVQGLCRATIESFVSQQPSFTVRIQRPDDAAWVRSADVDSLLTSVRRDVDKLAELGKSLQPELSMVLQSVEDPGRMADLVSANLTLNVGEAQELLEVLDPVARLRHVSQRVQDQIGLMQVQSQIQSRAKEEMSKTQRDYYLREQLRQIRHELGDRDLHSEEMDELRAKAEKAELTEEARAEVSKQIRRLEQMPGESAEASVLRTYIEWLIELPWRMGSQDTLDLEEARRTLDEDHYNLEQVKERILDYLAVRKLRGGAHGPILCFLGAPGVGKTSLGRSIARAMGRRFVRASLGGVRDEAEIRGHRRTYVGALPGRIIQGIKQAGVANPVFLLDEIDKMGSDVRGDPSSALLEVLDPEQNSSFRDHYIGVPFDLSRVLFIATANHPESIPAPLRDRMETLVLSGYSEEEKLVIAERFLVPKQIAEAGLQPRDVSLGRAVLRRVIVEYTRESGLRELERMVAQLARKVARAVVEAGDVLGHGPRPRQHVGIEDVPKLLGPPRYIQDDRSQRDEVGVVNGLAWTSHGGEILIIEAQAMTGKGSLILTGQLGEVMRESAQAALSFARAHALQSGVQSDFYSDREIHIHVPSGAVPKDGPSAGVTMACALVSLFTGARVRHDVAMTGELTLRGRVLPIGGLKEKLLAAVRGGMTVAIVPAGNMAELSELPAHVRKRLTIKPVRTMDEVLGIALAPAGRGRSEKTRRRQAAARRGVA